MTTGRGPLGVESPPPRPGHIIPSEQRHGVVTFVWHMFASWTHSLNLYVEVVGVAEQRVTASWEDAYWES